MDQTKKGQPPLRETNSARRINRVAELVGAKTYLEIGVAKGRTFLTVRIPEKVAVDPRFRFDFSVHQGPGLRFHEMTSDEFFSSHAGAACFDMVFIDGLHTFEQAMRDFLNSLRFSHARTVWLIDDVVPIDEFSALTDPVQARALRRQAGNHSMHWHGDVYKVIFAIHDFHPEFSFVTIASPGNPQSLVWRAPRLAVRQELGSEERIAALDYHGFLRRKDLLNLLPETEAFELFQDSLAAQPAG